MYGLKDKDNVIVDVSHVSPNVSAEGILFNNCLYPQVGEFTIVDTVPDYVKPRRFKTVGTGFIPMLEQMNEYENLLIEIGRAHV